MLQYCNLECIIMFCCPMLYVRLSILMHATYYYVPDGSAINMPTECFCRWYDIIMTWWKLSILILIKARYREAFLRLPVDWCVPTRAWLTYHMVQMTKYIWHGHFVNVFILYYYYLIQSGCLWGTKVSIIKVNI